MPSPSPPSTSKETARGNSSARFGIHTLFSGRCSLKFLFIPLVSILSLYIFNACISPSHPTALPDPRSWTWPTGKDLERFSPSLSSLLVSRSAPSVRVNLRQGTVIGKVLPDTYPQPVEAFLGIPYALPPTGKRRFRPRNRWKMRRRLMLVSMDIAPLDSDDWSEDCLTVNVFRPRKRVNGTKLPVAVYIHGGAFNAGAGKNHDSASMMAWSEKPYIAINFNYRLGALGFLPSSVTAKEGTLNLGLYDQILLLQWVQQNVAEFGGNADGVTVFGLSAGAHSVGHHIMNYVGDNSSPSPLFHRAMIESGAATSRAVYPYNASLHETQSDEFLVEAGCANHPEEGDIMLCLRKISAGTIAQASAKVFDRYYRSNLWAFQPVIDGKIIKTAPIKAWEDGHWGKIPILTGFNTNEGSPFVDSNMNKSTEFTEFFKTLIPALPDSDIKELDRLYPDPLKHPDSPYTETRNIDVGSQFKRAQAAYGDFAYICPVAQTAHLASADQQPPVYLYHWALNKTVKDGASHADNLEYEVYSESVRKITPAQEKIAGHLHAYLTSFITTGDPNKIQGKYADRAIWEPFDAAGEGGQHPPGKAMLLGKGNDQRAGGNGVGNPAQMLSDTWRSEQCKFWWERSILTES